jgi:hypothetical protein
MDAILTSFMFFTPLNIFEDYYTDEIEFAVAAGPALAWHISHQIIESVYVHACLGECNSLGRQAPE